MKKRREDRGNLPPWSPRRFLPQSSRATFNDAFQSVYLGDKTVCMREKHCLRSGRSDGENDAHVPQCLWLGVQVSGMRKMFLVRMPFLPVFLLLIAACLPIASNGFYCGSISLVLPGSLEECLSDKRLDTLALLPQYRCRGTSVPDKTGRHFYVSANLSFLMDEFLSCLPKKFPSCLHIAI
jgi:hypothetical protein